MKSGAKIVLSVILTAVVVGGASAALFSYERKASAEVDPDRLTVTMPGKSALGTYTSLYVWCIHDSVATNDHKTEPLGPVFGVQLISAYEAGDGRISEAGDGYYTVDLSGELPNGASLSKYLESGGEIGAIVSYSSADLGSRIQSADLAISEAGDHRLTLPESNNGAVEDEVTPYRRSAFGDFLGGIFG